MDTQAPRGTDAQDITVDAANRRLNVLWSDGRSSRYPFVWLRHSLFYPSVGRPEQSPDAPYLLPEEPETAALASVRSEGDNLDIKWKNDGKTTRHSLSQLRRLCNSPEGRSERIYLPKLWDREVARDFHWFDFDEVLDAAGLIRIFFHLRDHGIALLRNVPATDGQVVEVARDFGPLRVTHFGTLFDIRSKPEDQVGTGQNIGGTAANAQAPHTDETWRHSVPGMQFFHCLKPDPSGGGQSIFTDGLSAAHRLRQKNPEAFDFLTKVPIVFAAERNPKERFRARGRMIAVDIDGIIRGVRFADRTLPPLDLPERLVEPAYRAIRAFATEMYSPEIALERTLQSGECVIFDNHRVLHTRRAFNKQAGERHIQVVTVDREEFHNRFRQLAEAQGFGEDAWMEQDSGALAQSLMLD